MVQSGVPFDITESCDRQYKMIDSYLELIVNSSESETGSAKRAMKADAAEEVVIEAGDGSEGQGRKASAMKQARDRVNSQGSD